MINSKLARVLKGYSKLTSYEQEQFRKATQEFDISYNKESIKKGWEERADVGPTDDGGCVCCGR